MSGELNHFPIEAVSDHRYRAAQKVTWVSVAANLVLTIAQVGIGLLANAQSLVADGFHSLSDLLADFLVLYANYHGRHPADDSHPYGHQRIETAASLGLGLMLVAAGAAILWSAATRVQMLDSLPPVASIALWTAVITLVAKEGLFRYMLDVGEQLRSPMLIANAWHARSDALSSIVVAVGLTGSLLGYRFLDPIAAVLVGFMIMRTGIVFAWDALRELIDTSVSNEEVAAIRASILATPGVANIHALRTRRMAHKVLVDVHVRVAPRISVSEGQMLAEIVRQKVSAEHPEVLDILVQVDAVEDRQCTAAAAQLPPRDVLETHLRSLFTHSLPADARIVLHFLGNQAEAEVLMPQETSTALMTEIETSFQSHLKNDPWFSAISFYRAQV